MSRTAEELYRDGARAPLGTAALPDNPQPDESDALDADGPAQAPVYPLLVPVIAGLALVIALAHLYFNTVSDLSDLRVSALHFGLFGLFCALTVPLVRTENPLARHALFGVDVLLGLSAMGVALYLFAFEEALYDRGTQFIWSDWLAAGAAVILALEFTRRTMGLFIPLLTLLALSYVVLWGQWIDGVFAFPGLGMETLLYRSYFGSEGLFGSIAQISWSFVFMFILFGTFLVRSGAGDFIIDLARLAAGRITGGPGFVAVLSSGLMGSVTGSAVANTVSTGVITIPLMKRAGFRPRFAAGIEAAASTGGQVMPPIMGAGAFVMATFTQISYLEIIAAAAVPALLYFLSVAFFVRIEARREQLIPVADPDLKLGPVLQRGWHFLIPLGVLITMLIQGFTPTFAAGFATLAVIVISWLSPRPMTPRAILDAVTMAARTMTGTAMLLITVGLIIMVINTTGIGNTVSLMINAWAGGSLLLTLVLVALASLVLGIGLPVTASYIVLAALSAAAIRDLMLDGELVGILMRGEASDMLRAMVMLSAPDMAEALNGPMSADQARAVLAAIPPDLAVQLRDMAIDPAVAAAAFLSAHMIIFWLSQDSNVTPPVCLAAFAAASLARTPPMATGFTAWRVAKGLYILPVLFAYTPLVGGDAWEVARIAVFAAPGLYALTAAIEGHLESPLTWPLRLAALALGLVLLWPGLALWIQILGVLGFAALFLHSRRAALTPS